MIELAHESHEHTGSACIKVIGVGGAGGNTVNSIIESGYQGIEYVVANTDLQALDASKATKKIRLGVKSTKGLGTGANPEIGKRAAEENLTEIIEAVEDADIVFLTAGMGGGTGSGALPVIARALKERGTLTIAVVTKPFVFEGKRRAEIAAKVVEQLKQEVDTLIVIPNQKLLEVVDERVSMIDAFNMINNVLGLSVKGIADIISKPGHINVDFADVRTIMKDRGFAIMGTAMSSGATRAVDATHAAISSPLLENINIKGARAVLLNITGNESLSLHEISQAASIIHEQADADAQIILGSVIDKSLGDSVSVTIIATGFTQSVQEDIEEAIKVRATVLDTVELSGAKQAQSPAAEVVAEPAPVEQAPVISLIKKGDHADYAARQDLLLDQEELDVPAFLRKEGQQKSENA